MVKIRLRRIGTKGRPFYRVVVAKSSAGRNGAFVETLGIYDPVAQPHVMEVNSDRALEWLRQGAVPTETVAYILNHEGILQKFLQERPNHQKKYKFLDKRTAAISMQSHVTVSPEVDTPVRLPKVETAPKEEEVSTPESVSNEVTAE